MFFMNMVLPMPFRKEGTSRIAVVDECEAEEFLDDLDVAETRPIDLFAVAVRDDLESPHAPEHRTAEGNSTPVQICKKSLPAGTSSVPRLDLGAVHSTSPAWTPDQSLPT